MIIKRKDGHYIISHTGKNLGGPYSMKEAKKRLQQIEYFKHMTKKAEYLFNKYALKDPIPPAPDIYLGEEEAASQPGGLTRTVDDALFAQMSAIKYNNEGVRNRYLPSGDGSPKLMYEGHGLKKFTGKFLNAKELHNQDKDNKSGLVPKFENKIKKDPFL